MHARNPYRHPPDFEALADAYPPLRTYIISSSSSSGRKTIDFQNEHAERRLTEAILYHDFGIKLELPVDRLCPPVPNRMNYVLWIQDIVDAHSTVLDEHPHVVRGIDIGTGASVIYPFLGCNLHPNWHFVATEIDDQSYHYAKFSIEANDMQSRIRLLRSNPGRSILFPLEEDPGMTFDFTMCNPPFYSSAEEVARSASNKELPPNAVCTGAEVEMIFTPGGEVAFVGQMVEESEKLRTRCKWYTSMLGKLSSVSKIVAMLQRRSISNYAITEFVQGQTRRWAVGWSFTDAHLPDSVARIPNLSAKHALYTILPPRNTLIYSFPQAKGKASQQLQDTLLQVLSSIPDLSTDERKGSSGTLPPLSILAQAAENTWSRGARRRRRKLPSTGTGDNGVSVTPETVPSAHHTSRQDVAKLSKPPMADRPASPTGLTTAVSSALVCSLRWTSASLEFQWIYGSDRALFESFVNHVERKVGAGLQ